MDSFYLVIVFVLCFRIESDDLPDAFNPAPVYHVTWLSDSHLLFCSNNVMGDATVLHSANIDWDNKLIKAR